MDCQISELEKRIEETRKRLYYAHQKQVDDDQLLAVSQELDTLLNEYKSLLIKNEKGTNNSCS